MLKSITSKIFFGFALLVLLEAGVLAFVFGKSEIRSAETSILEALSKRVQTKAEMAAQNSAIFRINQESSLNDNLPPKFSRESLSALLPPSGSSVTHCKDESGKSFFCAFSFVPELKAWVFDFAAEETLSEAVLKRLMEIAPYILALLAAAMALTYILSQILLLPLKRFAKASEIIAKGGFDEVELPLERKDEVGDLALAFQKMISDLKERELNLRLSALKLAHSARLASVGQMGASLAHEVKNPLTSMMGYAKVLLQKTNEPELREAAEVIQKESERCNQILQQMLRFTRNDPAESKPYSLAEVIQAVTLLLKAEARTKQINLQVEKSADPIVVGSGQQIQQVLINLLMNSFQASPSGASVVIRLKEEAGNAILEVEDHGSGIPAEIQSKIFDPFFTTKSQKEGTGLGLSVSKDIVNQQGGSLSFTSSAGAGTRFRISLPVG